MPVKVTYQIPGRPITLVLEAADPKQAFRGLTAFGEIFTESKCGSCGSEDIKYEHRKHDDNDYYSLRCNGCQAQFDFGQHKTGSTLFAKRDKGDKGWYHYQRQEARSDQPSDVDQREYEESF